MDVRCKKQLHKGKLPAKTGYADPTLITVTFLIANPGVNPL
ncbi:hypothetical protein C942_02162 [Photobacterium marinum]|uniref:Uncharacterized protein n=1 Tax=Photobacterium marinum TaxID=1056511 RepID=L8J7L4_9GAMM|nr:hypothetical protein C942_02162 [Photobacterium marinum]